MIGFFIFVPYNFRPPISTFAIRKWCSLCVLLKSTVSIVPLFIISFCTTLLPLPSLFERRETDRMIKFSKEFYKRQCIASIVKKSNNHLRFDIYLFSVYRDAFNFFDKSKKGYLVADDFERALTTINSITETPTSREDAESLVREYDVNGKSNWSPQKPTLV